MIKTRCFIRGGKINKNAVKYKAGAQETQGRRIKNL